MSTKISYSKGIFDAYDYLLKNHKDYTSSSKAASILNDWPKSSKNFIKVMPTDYKNALALLAAEKEQEQNA